MRRTSVYAYESNVLYFARLRVRLCAYANVCLKKEAYLGLKISPSLHIQSPKPRLLQNTWTHTGRPVTRWETPLVEGLTLSDYLISHSPVIKHYSTKYYNYGCNGSYSRYDNRNRKYHGFTVYGIKQSKQFFFCWTNVWKQCLFKFHYVKTIK